MELEKQKVKVSIYHSRELFFLVAIYPPTNKILKIMLPHADKKQALKEISEHYPDYELSPEYEDIAREVAKLYFGENSKLELEQLELNCDNQKSPIKTIFMRNVLLETYNIPKGKFETYKSLAQKLNTHAYRAVGTALARNPFPLIIPCHRVLRSDKTVGKFGGGSEMKKELLKREGVKIKGNKVVNKK
jgi:methylated-DNA-[protein]-cysteine S-methyltransferase